MQDVTHQSSVSRQGTRVDPTMAQLWELPRPERSPRGRVSSSRPARLAMGQKKHPALLASVAILSCALMAKALLMAKTPDVRFPMQFAAPPFSAAEGAQPHDARKPPTLQDSRSVLARLCACLLAVMGKLRNLCVGRVKETTAPQVTKPQVHVKSRRLHNVVTGSVVCSAGVNRQWAIVRDCLAGKSQGVLRQVEASRVLFSDGNAVVIGQRCRWSVGPLRGRSDLVHKVFVVEKERRITFSMIKEDSMMRSFVGELQVLPHRDGALITMRQTVEGQSHIMSALAGITVLRGMLRHQCECTLADLAAAGAKQ